MKENQANTETSSPDSTGIRPADGLFLYAAEDGIPSVQVDVRELFGPQARLLHTSATANDGGEVNDLPQEIVLFGSTIVLFLLYCLLIRRYGYIVPLLFKSVLYKRSAMKLNDSLDVNISDMLALGTVLFLLCLSAMAYSVTLHLGGFENAPAAALWFMPGAMAALGGISLFRFLFHAAAGWLGGGRTFLHEIRFYNKIRFTFWAVWLTPLVLLCCFTPPNLFQYTIYIAAFGLGILLIQRIAELYQLFMKEKVSFLQYILYFCTVELLPVSFLMVCAWRRWAAF